MASAETGLASQSRAVVEGGRSRDEERPATRTARGAEEPGRTPRNRGSMLPRMLAADGRGLELVPEGSRHAIYPIPTVEGSPKTDRHRLSFRARVLVIEAPSKLQNDLQPPMCESWTMYWAVLELSVKSLHRSR